MSRYLVSLNSLKSKNNGSVLLFKPTFRHGNRFLFTVIKDGKDGHGLKLTMFCQLFQVLMICPQKSPK